MKTRLLGTTGVRVSSVGLGTMSFGGDADEATSQALFDRAFDAGVNLFDTADMYGSGRSEELLGKFVRARGVRDRVVLATKAYFPMGEAPTDRGSSRFHLVRAVEASLRRLGTDRIDLFYLHRWDDDTALESTLRALEDLVRQGKILYPAVSNFAAWQAAEALGLARALGLSPIVATQPMYNLAKRQVEVEILPHARAAGLAVIPYSPLGGGLFTGKYGAGKAPEAGRLVESKAYRIRYGAEHVRPLAEAFAAVAAREGVHPATLAVAWVRSHPDVTAPLLGARNVEQLEPSLAGAEFEMSAALREELCALTPAPPSPTDRNEEGRASVRDDH